MLNVDSCLCFVLETGGLIIGWLYFIYWILFAVLFTISLILTCITSCNDYRDYIGKDGVNLCNGFHGIIIGVLVVTILIFIGFAFIAWRCIQGANTRNHTKVRGMMIFLAILTVLSILEIISLTKVGIVYGSIGTVLNAYFFVVIYSLYERYRREAESGGNRRNVQYQVAGKV